MESYLKGFDENYLIYNFVLKTMNIRVFDHIRRKLAELSDIYKCGGNTGCLYDTKHGKVDFEVRIPIDNQTLFDDINEIMIESMLNKQAIIEG